VHEAFEAEGLRTVGVVPGHVTRRNRISNGCSSNQKSRQKSKPPGWNRLVVEKIVLFITGDFPEEFDVRDFAPDGALHPGNELSKLVAARETYAFDLRLFQA